MNWAFKNQMLMIGDTSHDLEMARAAEVDSVAVTYGAHPEEGLRACKPLNCFSTVSSLSAMAETERLICPSVQLLDSGKGMRFEVEYFGETGAGLRGALRRARLHGYLNRCAHVAMELDWQEGVFFDSDGRDLLCSTHGATYDTASGRCVGGPCSGTPLVKLRVEERDGMIYFKGFEDD